MPHWRWPSWLIAIWSVLLALFMVVVYVTGINDRTKDYEPASFLIGSIIVGFVIWAVPMAVLGPIWYFTRKQQVQCAGCGATVETSWNVCPRCGCPVLPYRSYAMQGQVPPYPPQYGQQFPPPAPPSAPWGQPAPPASSSPYPPAYPAPQPNTLQPPAADPWAAPTADPWAAPSPWNPAPPAGQPPEEGR